MTAPGVPLWASLQAGRQSRRSGGTGIIILSRAAATLGTLTVESGGEFAGEVEEARNVGDV